MNFDTITSMFKVDKRRSEEGVMNYAEFNSFLHNNSVHAESIKQSELRIQHFYDYMFVKVGENDHR